MKIYQPREELRPYVHYYWVLKGDEPFSILTLKAGVMEEYGISHKRLDKLIGEILK